MATEARPNATKFEETKKKYDDIENAKLNFSGTKHKPVPDFDKMEAPVKLTAAAVKREALALKVAEQIEEKRLKDLEWNQRDESELMQWRKEMD